MLCQFKNLCAIVSLLAIVFFNVNSEESTEVSIVDDKLSYTTIVCEKQQPRLHDLCGFWNCFECIGSITEPIFHRNFRVSKI